MTINAQENVPVQENKPNDKEFNFRALQSKYEKQLAEERSARIEAERLAKEALERSQGKQEEENDDEPYVDHRKLEKKLSRFGEQTRQQTQSEIQKAVQQAIVQERQQNWVKNNPDFYDVLQNHSEKFAQVNPELAETILEMPEGFERQKLVYKNIKALGLDKPEQKQQTIQDKIDANKRSPYYQPTGVGAAPYAASGDFSTGGQKQAYAKMQELKSRLRI